MFIVQKVKLIAFYGRKLTDDHKKSTVTEKEMSIIVEILHEFKNILLGHKLRTCTDNKNRT